MTRLRIGNGLDVHPFGDDPDRRLVLCGVEIPDGPGLEGHSDADVGAHAVTDALLGAMALGDLGSWFGVDDPAVAGADSLGLLARVVATVADRGWEVGNVDLTVVAQRPRLAAHRDAMRARLAATLQVEGDDVSVKFTTTDRLGSLGRGEGIAAWATITAVPRNGAPSPQ
ncbi:MAG: 2-C-methyl-D-erythritol 2,4-cyclodiphosphate synthase [Egicoccus sp.]